MRIKILAGIYFLALTFLILKAEAQTHNHKAQVGGVVVMMGSGDHVELTRKGEKLFLRLSDSNRQALKPEQFAEIKAELILEKLVTPLKSETLADQVRFTLPTGSSSEGGVKVTLKRSGPDASTVSQALPLKKVPTEVSSH